MSKPMSTCVTAPPPLPPDGAAPAHLQLHGALALLLATAVWGAAFPAMKTLQGQLTPLDIIGLRFGIAFIVLWPLCRVLSGGIRAREWRWGAVLGVVNFAAFWLQIEGLMHTSSNRNAFLTGLNVLFVPLLSWLVLRRTVGTRVWLACAMALCGVTLIFFEDAPWNWGDTLSLVCALAFAAYILTLEACARHNAHAPLRAWCVAAALSAVMCACALLMLSAHIGVGKLGTEVAAAGGLVAAGQRVVALDASSIWAIAYLALLSSALCMVLEAWGQQRIDASRSAIVYGMEPVFAAAAAWFLLGETLGVWAILGVILVVGAMVYSQIGPDLPGTGAKNPSTS